MKAASILKPVWDKVTLNAARLERGMEEASIGGEAIGPLVLAGYYSGPVYQQDGLGGLGALAVATVVLALGLAAMRSRVDIGQFDKKKAEDYTRNAVAFYEANKDKLPAPK